MANERDELADLQRLEALEARAAIPEGPIERSLNIAREVPPMLVRNMLASAFKGFVETIQTPKTVKRAVGIPEVGDDLTQKITSAIGYQPKYPETAKGMELIATPGRLYSGMAKSAGEKTAEKTGSQLLGQMVEKSIEIAPYGIGRAPLSAAAARDKQLADIARMGGFKVSPLEKGAGGPISRTAATIAGEPRLARGISQKNVELATAKIAEDLGLPPDIPITTQALQGVRKAAGAPYEAVKKSGTIAGDQQYLADLMSIRDRFLPAAKELGGKTGVFKDLKGIAQDQFSAHAAIDRISQLRESASSAFTSGNRSEGAAYRAMAKALEDQVGRHVATIGKPELLTSYQAGRQTLAKVDMAEDALNAITGRIDPNVYGTAAKEGKYLTGPGAEVGVASAAFPRSFQAPSIYQGTGPAFGDLALAAASRVANPASLIEPLLTLGARPALRGLLASGAGQSAMGMKMYPGLPVAPGLLYREDEESR